MDTTLPLHPNAYIVFSPVENLYLSVDTIGVYKESRPYVTQLFPTKKCAQAFLARSKKQAKKLGLTRQSLNEFKVYQIYLTL